MTIEGERHFCECDEFIARFILNRNNFNEGKTALWTPGWDCVRIEASEDDIRLFRFFCLTLLWRAAVSSKPFFSDVEVGGLEPHLRRAILAGRAPGPAEFPISVEKHTDSVERTLPIRKPRTVAIEGGTFACFPLSQMTILIKLDDKPATLDLEPFVVGRSQRIWIRLIKPYLESEEAAMLRQRLKTMPPPFLARRI